MEVSVVQHGRDGAEEERMLYSTGFTAAPARILQHFRALLRVVLMGSGRFFCILFQVDFILRTV